MHRLVLTLVAVSAIGCSSNSPTAPAIANYGGAWSGAVYDSLAGVGQMTVTLVQGTGSSNVNGTWEMIWPGLASNGGAISGTVSPNGVFSGTFTSQSRCPINLSFTVSGNSMSGTYANYNCTIAESGTFTVTR